MNAKYNFRLALITAVILGLSASGLAAAVIEYRVTDLGTLAGPQSAAYSLDSAGTVVGCSTTASADLHAVQYDGALADLGTLGVDKQSMAFAINDLGQVVAQSYNLGDLQTHAMLWQGGTAANLGHFAPRDINAAGLIVGHLTTFLPDLWVEHACQWNAGILTDLGTLGGRNSRAFAVNTAGRIVGQSFLADDLTVRACLWQNGTPHDLGALDGAANSAALDINDTGRIVGWSETADGSPHAFSVQVDAAGIVTMRTDLGALGDTFSYAYGINNAGNVVGTSNSRAILWRAGQLFDLNSLIPSDTGWTLDRAHALNDSGWIVGEGTFVGAPHGFLLTPCPRGDIDGDCRVNLLDFTTFAVCFAGPGVTTPPDMCPPDAFAAADLDADGDVDLADFTSFATNFTG